MRARGWCFTINNYSYEDLDDLMDLYFRYLCFGFERGDKGTPHIQGYIYFDDAKTRSSVSKKLSRAWLTVAKGSPDENLVYCSKQGVYYEFGIIPAQGEASYEKIKDVMLDPYSNLPLYNQYRRVWKDLEREKKKEHDRNLYTVHRDRLFDYIKLLKKSVCFGTEIDCYNGEEVLVLYSQYAFNIERWQNGFPEKIKRGYEVHIVDPEIVILVYDDEDQKKKYTHSIGWLIGEVDSDVEDDSSVEVVEES